MRAGKVKKKNVLREKRVEGREGENKPIDYLAVSMPTHIAYHYQQNTQNKLCSSLIKSVGWITIG